MLDPTHIITQKFLIGKTERNVLNEHGSCLIWFTGLSGSGKSTIAEGVEILLYKKGIRTYILDGDNIRHGLNNNLDFSEAGRRENIRRIGEVAKLFVDAGVVVLTTFISPFKKDRDQVRSLFDPSEFTEIYVDCPLEVCETRDVKGLYKKARAGEITDFTGISSPFEIPEKPEIIIESNKITIDESTSLITTFILKKILIDQ